jgi:hypothetical protein
MDPYQFHYHIRWSRLTTLGYEAFNTRAAAEASAEQSVLQGETYAIEEHEETCSRCVALLNAAILPPIKS